MSKKITLISVFIILFFSFLFHSVYDAFPNFLTSIFFPVNESIWEHNKLIFISYLSWMFISLIINRRHPQNTIFTTLVSSIICMTLVTLIFSPIYFWILDTEENFIVAIVVLTISIIISQLVAYYLMDSPYNKKREKTSLIIIIILVIVFGYLTYNPIQIPLFYDYSQSNYGIAK